MHDVVVVVGYLGDEIAASVRGHEGIAVTTNLQHEGNGSISSLAAAHDGLSSDVLILNSDLVYERQLLQALLAADCNLALVASRARARAQDVHLLLRDRRILDVGKHIPTGESDAAFCGAGLVRQIELARFAHTLEQTTASSMRTGWSFVFRSLAAEGVEVRAIDYDGPWWNINSVRDYTAAQQWARAKWNSGAHL